VTMTARPDLDSPSRNDGVTMAGAACPVRECRFRLPGARVPLPPGGPAALLLQATGFARARSGRLPPGRLATSPLQPSARPASHRWCGAVSPLSDGVRVSVVWGAVSGRATLPGLSALLSPGGARAAAVPTVTNRWPSAISLPAKGGDATQPRPPKTNQRRTTQRTAPADGPHPSIGAGHTDSSKPKE
jgi:hypothetical protein